ncbi:MAG: TIGR03759 family integrating conjugative element protein [Gammaproteobacteria bacterium]|nr:TIGR03759 family integrating conjugative element protein [Gammaproteobacteria bacterium]
MPAHRLTLGLSLVAWLAINTQAAEITHSQHRDSGQQTTTVDSSEQRRLQWDLSEHEWQRYQTLMQGIRGSISPSTISPLEVLGTHARNDKERRHYAKRWAKLMHDDVDRILKFQAAYQTAWTDLYGVQPLVDISQLKRKPKPSLSIHNGDRITVFIKPKDCTTCQLVVHKAAEQILKAGATLDVYFVTTQPGKDDQLITHWAQTAGIKPADVKARRITLNHESGELMQMTGQVVTRFPLIFKIKPNSIEPIPVSRFQ